MKQKRTWRWARVAGLLAAFGLLVYMFRHADPRYIWSRILGMEPRFLVPVLVGAVVMPLARALRLRFIMDPDHHAPIYRAFSVYNVGQLLNIFLPALTGQVARVVLFARTLQVTKTFAFTMVMLEVLFDGLVLVVMVFATSFLIVLPPWMERGEVAILVGCLLLFGFFYLVLHRQNRQFLRQTWFRRRMPARVVREWDSVKSSFLAGLNMLRSTRHLVIVALLSIAAWLAHALIVLFLLRAFSLDVPFWGAMVILIVNTLAIMVPLSPGNIGTFQLACIVGLKFFGVAKDDALGFSILLHLAEVGPVFVLGSVASFSQHVHLREYKAAEVLAEQEKLAAESPVFDGILGNVPDCASPSSRDRA